MSQRLKIVIVLIVVLAIGAWVLVEAPKNAVLIQEGTAAGFWQHACPDQSTDHGLLGGFYAPREGWWIYYDQYIHGQIIYRVKESLILEDFPRVRAALAARPEDRLRHWDCKALEAWRSADPDGKSPECLLAELKKARSDAMRQEQPSLDWSRMEEANATAFAIRWARERDTG